MAERNHHSDSLARLAFIGTYLPRRCGIATFTSDVAESVGAAAPGTQIWAVAMNDRPEGYRYPHRVKFEINHERPADYGLAAEFLNSSHVDLVSVQHEYGIFGGPDGNRILALLKRLRMPVVTTLHTVLREPTAGQRRTMLELAELSDRLVVLAHKGVEFLTRHYGVPESKIAHIPHGIPDVPFIDPNYYKDQFGVEGRKVILTFGLLSPNKGIETMIDAMAPIVKVHPEAVYVVLGATHPHVVATYGEDYRTTLEHRAEQRGVGEHVVFHNRFVDIKELCEFLGAADAYVTPYLGEAQIVSGSLAYALGAGNAVVSTPYWYAQELLADGRGRLVPFQDPEALAETLIELFDDDAQRHALRKHAYHFTRDFIWPRVGADYLKLFAEVSQQHKRRPHAGAPGAPVVQVSAQTRELPEIKLDHLHDMTDDTAVFQHAKGVVPDRDHGYTTDDTARALIIAMTARDHVPSGSGCTALARCYLSFLSYAFDEQTRRFRNFMRYDRTWIDQVPSEDSHGRTLWALGEAVARADHRGHANVALRLFREALPPAVEFGSPRAWAYSLIGIHAYLRRFGGDTEVKRRRAELSAKLMGLYESTATDEWPWPENLLTYANARLPHALLLCGQWMFEPAMVEMALRSLEWLVQVQTAKEGHFSPVGCHGWFIRGQNKARYDQQPIEAHATIEACLEAHRVTRQPHWLDRAFRIFNWYLGDNDLRIPVYDATTGGCHDGLHPQGLNENQGAESLLSWLGALLALYEHRVEAFADNQKTTDDGSALKAVDADHSQVPG